MLPSLLARDIQQGLEQFLITGFEPFDDFEGRPGFGRNPAFFDVTD
jgi:hypothetical protein